MRLKTVAYTVESEKLTGNVRLVLLTDLHAGRYGDRQAELLGEIDRQQPDAVLLGGDICDENASFEPVEELLRGLGGYPCYYVTGNHEYWFADIQPVLELFRSYGVTVLEGTQDVIGVNGQLVRICGVDDPFREVYADTPHIADRQLDALAASVDPGMFTVLLAHRPERLPDYANRGFDLVLSGHAHGGQWRIPGLANGLYAPHQGWLPRYAGGEYELDGTRMIVSRGLARWDIPAPRVFNRPELVVVELVPR